VTTQERMGVNATYWVLPSTPGSKYAHAPAWSVHSGDTPQRRPACGIPLPAWDPYNLPDAETEAEGKPPCPKCIRMLRHHLRWLGEWVESYENLEWADPGEPE
jgi:hypothetical protein